MNSTFLDVVESWLMLVGGVVEWRQLGQLGVQVVKLFGPTLDWMRPVTLMMMLRIFWLSKAKFLMRSSHATSVPLFIVLRYPELRKVMEFLTKVLPRIVRSGTPV